MDQTKLAQKLSWIIAAILVLLPFHAFFTTWLGSNFGHLDVWRIWKELIIVGISPIAIWLAWQDRDIKKWLKTSWLPRLILLYALLFIFSGVWAVRTNEVNGNALIYSLLANLRFLGFFMICLVVAAKSEFLRKHLHKIILLPAAIVILFGLLQRFILPYDFLRHFGYGPDTIPAYQTIDNKIEYRRIQSTLRGANPLGAYLVLIIPILVIGLRKQLWLRWLGILSAVTVFFYSYSRSAWLGAGATIGLLTYWLIKNKKLRQAVLVGATIGVLLAAGAIILFRNNYVVQNTVFHTATDSTSPDSSNEDRLDALQVATEEVISEPLGRGPGTAGTASFRNNHAPRIAENYFLQIGQEVGWLGILLFAAINVLVVAELWGRRRDHWALLLIAIFTGLTLINLLSHAWADDTLGLLWWGVAGIVLAPVILQANKQKHDEKTAKARS